MDHRPHRGSHRGGMGECELMNEHDNHEPVPGEARWRLNTASRPDHVDEPHYPEDDTRHLYVGDRGPGWQGGKLRHERYWG